MSARFAQTYDLSIKRSHPLGTKIDRLFTLSVHNDYSSVPHKINMNHKEKFDEYCKVTFTDGENKGSKAMNRDKGEKIIKFLSHLIEITALKISVPNLSTVTCPKHMTIWWHVTTASSGTTISV